MRIDQELDLRGEVCPYTFVKTKLALETMESGKVLEITVDHLPAVENVPRSVSSEGHEVLDVHQANATDWSIIIRKVEEED
ncbi:MAG: sulfurtransferase TusA family protein [Anaerolineae bacterium]|jgi:TusA-related sulfurtransferase